MPRNDIAAFDPEVGETGGNSLRPFEEFGPCTGPVVLVAQHVAIRRGFDAALQHLPQGALIALLLSPVAGYMTGALLNIDGGTNF